MKWPESSWDFIYLFYNQIDILFLFLFLFGFFIIFLQVANKNLNKFFITIFFSIFVIISIEMKSWHVWTGEAGWPFWIFFRNLMFSLTHLKFLFLNFSATKKIFREISTGFSSKKWQGSKKNVILKFTSKNPVKIPDTNFIHY